MRIAGIQFSDDDIDKRSKAVGELAAGYDAINKPDAALRKAAEIAVALSGDGSAPDPLEIEVQDAISKYASSFIASERPLEVGACSALAALSLFESAPRDGIMSGRAIDVLAAGLWSALSFQEPLEEGRREALRAEVVACAKQRVLRVAEDMRRREDVALFSELPVLDAFANLPSALRSVTNNTIEALRRNAELDREEVDFLWWTMSEHSRLLKRKLLDLDELPRGIVRGIEAAGKLQGLPCDAHRDLVVRCITKDKKANLHEVLRSVEQHRTELVPSISAEIVAELPGVFPLLSALVGNSADVPGAASERSASEWSSRALLEAALLSPGPWLKRA